MRAYRVRTGSVVEVFGDPVGDSPILNVPLRDYQRVQVEGCGLALVDVDEEDAVRDPGPHVVFRDDLFFTRGLLEEFLELAVPGARSAVVAVPRTDDWERIAALQDAAVEERHVRYDALRYVVPGSGDPAPVVVDTTRGLRFRMPMPKYILASGQLEHIVSDKYLVQIVTPMHIHIANTMASVDRIACYSRGPVLRRVRRWIRREAARRGKLEALDAWIAARREKMMTRTPSKMGYRIGRHVNTIGKNCDIHPTAFLMGCVVGDNVRIGAYAVCEGSVIGDGAHVGEFCHIRLSVVGPRTLVLQVARLNMTVTYQDVFFLSRTISFGIIGREAQVYNSIYTDFRVDGGPMTTLFRGKIVDSRMPFLGVTVGHRARVAGGLIVGPGRIVPNDVTVLPPEDLVYARAPKGTKPGDVIRLGEKK